jgi:hypothetical protein
MKRLHEAKIQRWRALAIREDKTESLLCLGYNISQIKEYYTTPWYQHFTEGERRVVREIQLQKWTGTPDCGSWETQTTLAIPSIKEIAREEDFADIEL